MTDYTYYRNRLHGRPFPYVVLDEALLRRNIEHNLDRAAPKTIRVATKSVRCVAVLRYLLEYDDRIQGLMTYHGRETIQLADQGFDNLLLGYPVVEPALLTAIGERVRAGKQICLMVDSVPHLELVNAAGKALGIQLPVCIDLDLSDDYPGLHFGVWRSSIRGLPTLETLLDYLSQLAYVRLDGLMGYEAQLAGVGDKLPGSWVKNQVVRGLQQRSVRRLRAKRQAAVELIESLGFELRFVNGGGTGSLETTAREEVVTEVTVGSGFYASHLFDYYRSFRLEPAVFYAIPVVRRPVPGVFTCHGGGFIASGAVDGTKAPVVHLPAGGYLDTQEGAGEVQTPIRFADADPELTLGDPVFLRHAKAGELLEHFTELQWLGADEIRRVPTYRGAGWCFG
jgi:D-serine deaminase-like pyridoxal phosphate-dependent protein